MSQINTQDNYNATLICTWFICKYTFFMWKNTLFFNIRISHIFILKVMNMWSIGAPIDSIILAGPKDQV